MKMTIRLNRNSKLNYLFCGGFCLSAAHGEGLASLLVGAVVARPGAPQGTWDGNTHTRGRETESFSVNHRLLERLLKINLQLKCDESNVVYHC